MCEAVRRWIEQSKKKRAFWEHDNDPARPHLVLPNGEHVNRYADWEKVVEDPILLRNGAVALLSHLWSLGLDAQRVNRVLGVGRDMAGFAHLAAYAIICNRSKKQNKREECYSAHLGESMSDDRRRSDFRTANVREGEHVLVVLESFLPARARVALELVRIVGAEPVPLVGAVFNLSGIEEIGRHKVGSLVSRQVSRWSSAETCELCRKGSEAIKAKTKEDWDRVMKYD
jgi:hypothetical protein